MSWMPFIRSFDADDNLVLTTMFKGSPKKPNSPIFNYYEVSLVWDAGLNQFLLEKCKCGCTSYLMGRTKDPVFLCKHLNEFKLGVETKYPEELQ